MRMLHISLDQDSEKRLEAISMLTGRTKHDSAKQAILDFIEDREDHFVSLERLKDPAPTTTLEELEAQLGLEH